MDVAALNSKWNELGLVREIPPSVEDIIGYELRASISLPSDFKEFLVACGGMGEQYDPDQFRFWSWSDITGDGVTLGTLRGARVPFVPFADWLLASEVFYLRADDHDGVYRINKRGKWKRSADTVSSFVDKYLTDPDSLLKWAFWDLYF